jgi:hypothetical protein
MLLHIDDYPTNQDLLLAGRIAEYGMRFSRKAF